MEPIIRAVLETLLPKEDAESIPIIANDVRYLDPEHSGQKWEIIYRHPESGFGHDKSKAILPYRDLPHSPTLFFCGDGVSGRFILLLSRTSLSRGGGVVVFLSLVVVNFQADSQICPRLDMPMSSLRKKWQMAIPI